MIASMRIKWFSKHILIRKTDVDAAYRHIHANAQIATTFILIVGKLAFLYLVLPFGAPPEPAEYTTIGEAAIDLGNNLLADTS